jgi:hypothetical protein
MIMTDLAVRDLEMRSETLMDRCRRAFVGVFGRSSDHRLPVEVARRPAMALRALPAPSPVRKALRVVDAVEQPADAGEMRWQRHPQLRARQAEAAPMPGSERAARLAAERGIILARGRKLVEAVDAFTVAARDEAIDLGAMPGFWDLPRNGMLAAVQAYERVDRLRDAAALEARIRHLYRPRALKPIPAPRPSRMTASGD